MGSIASAKPLIVTEVSPSMREILTSDPDTVPWSPMAGAAIGYANDGFHVLPLAPNDKRPRTTGPFQHGARSATRDVDVIREHFLRSRVDEADDNVGVTDPTGALVFADVDPRHGGSLEALEAMGLSIAGFRYQTPSGGWRVPFMMPPGRPATRSIGERNGIGIRGPGSHVAAPWSCVNGRWYQVEPGREIWRYAEIPTSWSDLDKLTSPVSPRLNGVAFRDIHDADHAEATHALRLIEAGIFREVILQARRDQHVVGMRSEADARILANASWFLRDHERIEEILGALLMQTSAKLADHPNPDHYLAMTVRNVLNWRQDREQGRHDVITDIVRRSLCAVPDLFPPRAVIDPKGFGRGKSRQLRIALLAFAGSCTPDTFDHPGGWRRVPVCDMAATFGDASKDGELVRQAQVWLAARDLIERETVVQQQNGRPRADARIRLTEAGRHALAALRAEHVSTVLPFTPVSEEDAAA